MIGMRAVWGPQLEAMNHTHVYVHSAEYTNVMYRQESYDVRVRYCEVL